MGTRIEEEYHFNPDSGKLAGLHLPQKGTRVSNATKPAIYYQLGNKTKFTPSGWEAWYAGQPLAISYKGFTLGPDVQDPLTVETTEINAAPCGAKTGPFYPELEKV